MPDVNNLRPKLSWLVDGVLAICAIAVTITVLSGSLRSRSAPAVSSVRDSVKVPEWSALSSGGKRLGPVDAALTVVEFADFECPACRAYSSALKDIREEFPNDVAVVFQHWPLAYHRFARIAATQADCAGAQGRFERMHDLLFEKQDSFGIKPWSEYATAAGIPDPAAFEKCVSGTQTAHFDSSAIVAKRIGATGTPTLIINGWRLTYLPEIEELRARVKNSVRKSDKQ